MMIPRPQNPYPDELTQYDEHDNVIGWRVTNDDDQPMTLDELKQTYPRHVAMFASGAGMVLPGEKKSSE